MSAQTIVYLVLAILAVSTASICYYDDRMWKAFEKRQKHEEDITQALRIANSR